MGEVFLISENHFNILLAEDDEDINAFLAEILKEEGYKCVQVKNGLMATEELKKDHFDLLITDFNMPVMDGIELLEWCRKTHIQMPVIFISASMGVIPKEKITLEDCGAAILKKPLDVDLILQSVQEAKVKKPY